MSQPRFEILRPERSAHASIRGYLYQVCLGVKRWLQLDPGQVLLCEGDEDLDRLLLDASGISIHEQVKALTGAVNIRDRVVFETLRNFALTYVARREHGDRRRFLFTTTAELRPQRTGDLEVDVLQQWTNLPDRPKVIEAVRKMFLDSAASPNAEKTALAVEAAVAWLDAQPERWSDFIDSVEWRLGEPNVEELSEEIADIASKRPDAPHGLAALLANRLVARVLVASSRPDPEERVLDANALSAFLDEVRRDLAQWAASPQGRLLRETFNELAGINEVITPGTRPLPDQLVPSRLLIAAHEVIPFYEEGRRHDLARLADWCADDAPASVRLITGEGGAGKTRLLVEWCKRLRAQGWHAGFLPHRPPGDWRETLFRGQVPRLVVIDYAESRLREVETLLQGLAVHSRPKLRVVLLARRQADWWRQLAERSDEIADLLLRSPTPYKVAPLVPEPDRRPEMCRAVIQVFTAALGVDPPPDPGLPDFTDRAFNRALYLHMASLAALLGEPPASPEFLLGAILVHERRFWVRAFEGIFPSDGNAVDQLAEAADRFLAAATMIGGVAPDATAHKLVCHVTRLTPGEHDLPGALVRIARRFYGGPQGIEPLQPDVLGEQLVTKTLHDHPDLLRALLDWTDASARAQTLTVLNRLAARSPSESQWLRAAFESHLDTLADPALDVAVAAGDPIGKILADVLQSAGNVELAERLMDRCDTHALARSVPLRELAAVATQGVLDAERKAPGDRTERQLARLAGLANNLGNRHSDLGLREEALEATSEAVAIRRELADVRPDTFLPYLAASLNNLGNRYSELGRREEALHAAGEALEHYRKLADARPDAFLPYVAGTVHNLANRYSELGRREEALQAASEAVQHYRALADARPDAFLPDFATSLNHLGRRFGELGHREEALKAASEAVEIHRKLADARPDAFLPDLAASLNNLGTMYSELGRREEALEAAREAISALTPSFTRYPQTFERNAAILVRNYLRAAEELGCEPDPELLGPVLTELNKLDDAPDSSAEH